MKYLRSIRCLSTLFLVFTALCWRSPAWAVQPINTDPQGVAIGGYDPVAYFTLGKPVKGSEEFSHQWMGATWHFKSEEDLAMFTSNPERYAPQYGGY